MITTGNALTSMDFWDGVLIAGCTLAIFLGFCAGSSMLTRILRSGALLAIWALIAFVPIMFIGSLIGTAADSYQEGRTADTTTTTPSN